MREGDGVWPVPLGPATPSPSLKDLVLKTSGGVEQGGQAGPVGSEQGQEGTRQGVSQLEGNGLLQSLTCVAGRVAAWRLP